MVRNSPLGPSLLVCCTIVLLGLCVPADFIAQSAKAPTSSKHRQKANSKRVAEGKAGYAYFFDLVGDFEKIDIASSKESGHGQIPVAAKLVHPFETSGFNGCVLCGVRYDKKFGRFYVVMAKHLDDAQGGGDNFEIVSVAPPRMYTAMRADVSFAAPIILVNPDGSRVLASYQLGPNTTQEGQLAYGLSIFNAPALKLIRADKESTATDAFANGYVFKSQFSDQAYFGKDGSIYDQFSRSTLVANQLNKVTVDPVALLVKSGRKALTPFALVDVNTKASTFEASYVDSAAGKTLVALNASGKAAQALTVIDLKNQTFSAPMKVSEVVIPATHLTPDGTQILIEESELRHREGAKPDEPQEALFKTGKLILFDVTSLKTVREIAAPTISGFDSRLMCTSADGKAAFFADTGHLYAIDLIKGKTQEIAAQSQFVFDKWTRCEMADR
jgi:hypothetical protein